jgi:flagellar hook protein FlgE
VEYFDNLGTSQSINVTYTPTVPGAPGASNEWTMTLRDSAQGNAVVGVYTLTFDDTRAAGGTLASVTQPLVLPDGTPDPGGATIGGPYAGTGFQVHRRRGPDRHHDRRRGRRHRDDAAVEQLRAHRHHQGRLSRSAT